MAGAYKDPPVMPADSPPLAAASIHLATLQPGELLTEAEAAEILNCSRTTLANARSLKKGPPFVKVGAMVRYIRSRLMEWAA